MEFEAKTVIYSYNSLLGEPWAVDAEVQKGSTSVLNVHKTFKTKTEFHNYLDLLAEVLDEA